MDLTAPGVDPELEKRLDADRFAAIAVGDDQVHPVVFGGPGSADGRPDGFARDPAVRGGPEAAAGEVRLGVERGAADPDVHPPQARAARGAVRDVRVHGAGGECVGGDFFDFITVSERYWGVAIADASGHGLPAALQVRDVYTGLRMGVARDFKIVRTIERLNRIIHQSRMTTKFVSLFYGEIEAEGNFIYVNAGHPPPLHFHSKGCTTLKQAGMVLGPSGSSAYSRGFLSFEKGDALLLYTDGMIEASDGKGKEFGIERLKKAFLALRDRPAAEITRALIDRLGEFTQGALAGGITPGPSWW